MSEAHGLLLVDKPTAMTSHDVVAAVRRLLKTRAVGHAGTLDPLATGLMVLLLGEGTKLSDYLLNGDKSYLVRVQFGIETDTWDVDGEVLRQEPVSVTPQKIRDAVHQLSGDLDLPVPAFSAIKQKGKKLYELAREGKTVDAPVRPMRFYGVAIDDMGRDWVDVSLSCSKGSYIRSWAVALGALLGCPATVKTLRRLASQPYSVDRALPLVELQTGSLADQPAAEALSGCGSAFVSMAEVLPHWRALTVSGKDQRLLLNGQISHDLWRRLICEQKTANQTDTAIGIKVMSGDDGRLLSLLEARPFKGLKIKRVFKSLP
ncbi:MAG: tRNA pseudouridine(55) synthase TruB [Pseudobdellovibrionaceae bacterium]|nr:tRNA pseudouridine(55) synthase TruB [Bdellovibrionales bacterium]USN48741.1 MAG: tRNA pseudouridine(55) synthase TruB [Pseudobdellovibrionaceae bacterium]